MFKKVFCLECGLNVCENERGYSWNNRSTNFEAVWEICLIKCDFTTEIQPWTAESRIEPVSVGVVLIKKTRKIYISHICYVSERSFYKIHASEKLPLNYAFVKSVSNFIWLDAVCAAIWNANFWQQTENNSEHWPEWKWCHMYVRLAVNHLAALKRFRQTTFVALTKFAAPQILLQYMTSDYLTSCEQKTKNYRFTLVNKHEGTPWHFPVTFLIWMASKESSAENIERYVAIIVMKLPSDHSWRPITILRKTNLQLHSADICEIWGWKRGGQLAP